MHQKVKQENIGGQQENIRGKQENSIIYLYKTLLFLECHNVF